MNDELKHYGVLGMKWGIRRERKTGKKYNYESRATKKYKKKAAEEAAAVKREKDGKKEAYKMGLHKKLHPDDVKMLDENTARLIKEHSTKQKKYEQRAKASAQFDKNMEQNVRSYSAGKTAAKTLILMPWGAKTYEACKAAGYGRAGSAAVTLVGNLLGGPLGTMAMTAYARHDYVKRDELTRGVVSRQDARKR